MAADKKKKNKIRVIELFAGVGGFRLGLEQADKNLFEIVWSNQWEPATKAQHASDIYAERFGAEGHCNEDITSVASENIPEHDMLVGGFPCQDYSVAKTLKHSAGIIGKKGVLWWEIHRILKDKAEKPKYLLLENVDRLLKSPVKQRGRDFAIMLASLSDLGYIVEWRVINAADYGMPQRRRRVFFMAYHESTDLYQQAKKSKDSESLILNDGLLAETFIAARKTDKIDSFALKGSLEDITEAFNVETPGKSPFGNAGIVIDRMVTTTDVASKYIGPQINLGDVLLPENEVPEEFFINEKDWSKWEYQKGAKNEKRTNKASGFEYSYTEGGMVFPDALDKPSRTIITGEGGASASRFKHVVQTKSGRMRRLTPLELERLNMFPDNHTAGMTDIRRAFFMGNALVVGIIEKIGKTISKRVSKS